MSRRRCCCNRPCVIAQDDFNRPDSENLGPQWDEVSGDWSIYNQAARELTGDGQAVHKTPHRLPDESMVVSVDVPNDYPLLGTGAIVQLLLNVKYGTGGSANSYHLAEYILSNPAVIRLSKVTGGGYTLLAQDTVMGGLTAARRTFTAWIDHRGFCAMIRRASTAWSGPTLRRSRADTTPAWAWRMSAEPFTWIWMTFVSRSTWRRTPTANRVPAAAERIRCRAPWRP